MRCTDRFASASVIGAHRFVGRFLVPFLLAMLPALLLASSLSAQDVGSQEKEFMGNGSVITVIVHDASGTPLSSPATVKLFRGVVPSGQRDASRGVAEFVVIGPRRVHHSGSGAGIR